MKAYKIKDDIVAAENEPQAIGTWAAHFDVEPKTAGKCVEIDPDKFMLSFEKNDGSFEPGPLSDIMPEKGGAPEVLIDSEHS